MYLKNIIAAFLIILIIGCRPYKIKNIHFKSEIIKLNAKVDSIDSTANQYVYYISNDTLKAYFHKSKICKTTYSHPLELNKIYLLSVKTDAFLTYRYKTVGDTYLYVEDKRFGEGNVRQILLDCLNICGKTINIEQ